MPASFPPKQRAPVLGETIEFVSGGAGDATVVLVNGAGGPIEGWYKVFGRIAEFARVFAYNRPGIGGSSRPSVPQVASHSVASLRGVLNVAGLPAPYVLVGHSLGGFIVNLFARMHPSEVAGVVLVEATAPAYVPQLRRHESGLQRFLGGVLRTIAPPDPNAETEHVEASVAEIHDAPPFPAVRLVVITGGKPALSWATPEGAIAARKKGQQELSSLSPLGRQLLATRSGHFPQLSEPEVAIDAVAQVARMSRLDSSDHRTIGP